MQARRVTKAAIPPLSAVIASIVLAVSVSQSDTVASAPQAPPAAIVTPVYAIISGQDREHAAAGRRESRSSAASTLLPVVNQKDIRENHKILADTVLRKLPDLCRNNLKDFFVLYQKATQRGLGGKSSIILDGNVPDNEFVGLLIHECAHVIHANMPGHIRTGASAFKDGADVFAKNSPMVRFFSISWLNAKTPKPTNQKEDFASGYASSDAFEDFAEAFATYVLERPSMIERAKENAAISAKLDWMLEYLPLPANIFGTPKYSWNNKLPWDATKLAYEWEPAL